jgi:hypothetical protein
LQYCFVLCKINLFVKPFVGFYLVLSNDNIWLLSLGENTF